MTIRRQSLKQSPKFFQTHQRSRQGKYPLQFQFHNLELYYRQERLLFYLLTPYYTYYYDYKEGIDRNLGERNISRGMIRKDVLIIQQYLSLYDDNVPLTGEFEEKTENAVKGIQRMHFYHADVDGVVRKEHLSLYIR